MMEHIETEIVRAVADAKGVKPIELDYALYEYIDIEAIRRLADHENSSWTVSFELPEHDVIITSDGAIEVNEAVGKIRS